MLALIGLLVSPLSAAAQGVLLSVTHLDGDQEHYWWAEPNTPRWTESDEALKTILSDIGVPVVDPSTMPDPPQISRLVYGHGRLSTTNAINLAVLFGAKRLITGVTVVEPVGPSPIFGYPGFKVSLDLHVFTTNTTVELLPVAIEEVAFAEDANEARRRATERAFARARLMLAHLPALQEAEVGVPSAEPVLVVTGLEDAAPLVELKRQLKTFEGVTDVMEVWAAEGVVAVEINPGALDDPTLILNAIDHLLRQDLPGFSLQEVSRDAQCVEVIALPKLQKRETTGAGAP